MKKSLQIILCLLIVTMLTLSILSGCGSNQNGSQDDKSKNETSQTQQQSTEEKKEVKKVTLKFWGGVPEQSGPNQAVEAFNKLDPNLQVEYVRFTNDEAGNAKLDATLLSGGEVDVFSTYFRSDLTKRMNGGSILDLREIIKKENTDLDAIYGPLAQPYIEKLCGESRIGFLPFSFFADYMFFNKDAVDKAGLTIPDEWTWDEYREFCKKLTSNGVYGMAYPFEYGSDIWLPYANYFNEANDWLKNDGTTNYQDNPNYKAALNLIYQMQEVDKSIPSYTDVVTKKLSFIDLYLTGKANGLVCPGGGNDWLLRYVKDKEKYPHDFVTTFAPVPVMQKGQKPIFREALSDWTSINSKSSNQDAAYKFLIWLVQEGINYYIPFGRIPSNKETKDSIITEQMFGKDYLGMFEMDKYLNILNFNKSCKYVVDDFNGKYDKVFQILREESEKVLIKDKSVDDGIKSMTERADKVMKE